MKLSNPHFKSFLRQVVEDRLKRKETEVKQLQNLLNEIEELSDSKIAIKWVKTLQHRAKDLLFTKDIVEDSHIHRNNVSKATYDVLKAEEINPDMNLLPGVTSSHANVYFRDAYVLWKLIRDDEKYPTGEELERKYLLNTLPKEERDYLK